MRTKTLLIAAALSAVGAASSMAQVFSVNAVGYVNKTIPAGSFALISNPLNAPTNTINALFAGVPDGFQVYLFTPGKGYVTGTFDSLSGGFLGSGDPGNQVITPGMGLFVRNSGSTPVTITFVGEVPQGTDLKTPIVPGLQIISSQVPQAGTADALGLKGNDGDQIYQFDVAHKTYFPTSTYDGLSNAWTPPLQPLDVGDAFFLKANAAGSWDRNFSVNTP